MTSLLQTADAVAALPEILLAILAAAFLMVGAFAKTEAFKLVQSLAVAALVFAATKGAPHLRCDSFLSTHSTVTTKSMRMK